MDDCIFCDPSRVEGGIFYESDNLYVVLSTLPFTRGHSLVIPRRHFELYHEVDSDLMKKVVEEMPRIIKGVIQITDVQSYNIINNSGIDGNQTVNHMHIHIIPRYSREELRRAMISNGSYQYMNGDRERLLEQLKNVF